MLLSLPLLPDVFNVSPLDYRRIENIPKKVEKFNFQLHRTYAHTTSFFQASLGETLSYGERSCEQQQKKNYVKVKN